MNPETRLALARLEEIARGRTLAIDLTLPDATVLHTDLRAHHAAPGSSFGPWAEGSGFDSVVVRLHPAAERTRLLVAMAASAARAGATLTLVGHNNAGARSAGKFLDQIGEWAVLDTRYHCRAFTSTVARTPSTSLDEWRATFTFDGIAVVSYPGVFAHGRVDDGTKLLLSVLEPRARALDVGCGNGVISAWLLKQQVAVDAIDVDALAIEATRATAPNASVFPSDVFENIHQRYDLIVSNPPFHAGKRQTSEASVRLIEESPQHLSPGGQLWLVANRFLPYARVFDEAFGRFDVATETSSYRVYRARA